MFGIPTLECAYLRNVARGSVEREFLLTHKTLLWVRESGSEKFRFNKLLGKS